MFLKSITFILGIGTLFGCGHSKPGIAAEDRLQGARINGPWNNIYANDPNLAGVIVQQFPDGDDGFSFEERDGRHPCMILFGFWDDSFRQRSYSPSGVVTGDFRFKIDESSKWIWNNVDFSKGSDPAFKLHEDPRIRWSKPNKAVEATPPRSVPHLDRSAH